MIRSIARQREQHMRRHVEQAALQGTSGLHALGGEAHKAPGTFRPRSHGWCGAHNRNTKADSGTRHRAYPRGLLTADNVNRAHATEALSSVRAAQVRALGGSK